MINDVNSRIERVHVSVQEGQVRQQNKDIQAWLSPSDPSINYHKALAVRHGGSGYWLLQHEAFRSWKESSRSCLWLYGTSGCGKTVLSSTIIEHLSAATDQEFALLYFYFDFTDSAKQKLEDLLRSLVCQLGILRPDCQRLLEALFKSCKQGYQRPSCEELRNLFLAMLKSAGDVRVILDALDESTTRMGGKNTSILAWLTDLVCNAESRIQIIATSQPERDIQRAMDIAPGIPSATFQRFAIEGPDVEKDIHSYVAVRVRGDPDLYRWKDNERIQDKIEKSILLEADGMFRLVACRLDLLRYCVSEYELQQALDNLPENLNEVYQRYLQNVPKHRLPNTFAVLQLLLISPRPLEVKELAHAIAVDVNAEPYFHQQRCLIDAEDIALFCPGLAVIVQRDASPWRKATLFVLSHSSVKRFLQSDNLPAYHTYFQEVTAIITVADICISYLLQIPEEATREQIELEFPFAQFCSEYWYVFAAAPRPEPDPLVPKILTFLKPGGKHTIVSQKLHKIDQPTERGEQYRKPADPLYFASFAGFAEEARMLIAEGADVNARGGGHGSAIQAASKANRPEMVKLLLDAGADINARGAGLNNALQVALTWNYPEVVQVLLEAGADIHQPDTLQSALWRDRPQLVKLLVDAGIDVNAQECHFGSPLQVASMYGYEEVVRLLLGAGADINARGGMFGNALQAASYGHRMGIVELLIDSGADINAEGSYYGNVLQTTSDKGSLEMVKLLLAKGADVNAQCGCFGNALQMASLHDRVDIAGLLLSAGARVNAQGGKYGNALQAASSDGCQEAVKLLLAAGADINALGGEHHDALQAAAYKGSRETVQLLLDNGADISTQGPGALRAALQQQHPEVVKLLQDQGVCVDEPSVATDGA